MVHGAKTKESLQDQVRCGYNGSSCLRWSWALECLDELILRVHVEASLLDKQGRRG